MGNLAFNTQLSVFETNEIEFYRKAAHDIRSPLSAINMLKNVSDWNRPEVRELLMLAVSRISDISNDLLNSEVKITQFKVNDAVQAIVAEKKAQFAKENVTLVFSPSVEDYVVTGDISLFQRSLSNFINNSIDAMKGTRVAVCITVALVDGKILVQVSDNGIGMSEQTLNKLGKESFSAGNNKSATGSGHGLGVKGSVEMLKKMNADVQFASRQGVGTTVTISLNVLGRA